MARNIEKYAAEGRDFVTKGKDSSLTFSEMEELRNIATDLTNRDALMDALMTAFYFGAAVGNRRASNN